MYENFEYRIYFRPERKAWSNGRTHLQSKSRQLVHDGAFQQQWTSGRNMSTTADTAVEKSSVLSLMAWPVLLPLMMSAGRVRCISVAAVSTGRSYVSIAARAAQRVGYSSVTLHCTCFQKDFYVIATSYVNKCIAQCHSDILCKQMHSTIKVAWKQPASRDRSRKWRIGLLLADLL